MLRIWTRHSRISAPGIVFDAPAFGCRLNVQFAIIGATGGDFSSGRIFHVRCFSRFTARCSQTEKNHPGEPHLRALRKSEAEIYQ